MKRWPVARMVLAMLVGSALALRAQEAPRGTPQVPADPAVEIREGGLEGRRAAQSTSTRGWFFGGMASLMLVPPFGTIGVVVWAGNSQVAVPLDQLAAYANRSASYQNAFETTFAASLQQKRRRSVVRGALTTVGIIVIATSTAMAVSGP